MIRGLGMVSLGWLVVVRLLLEGLGMICRLGAVVGGLGAVVGRLLGAALVEGLGRDVGGGGVGQGGLVGRGVLRLVGWQMSGGVVLSSVLAVLDGVMGTVAVVVHVGDVT